MNKKHLLVIGAHIGDGEITGVYVVRNPDKLRRLGTTLH